MVYRAPIRRFSPPAPRRVAPSAPQGVSLLDIAHGTAPLQRIVDELQALKQKHQEDIDAFLRDKGTDIDLILSQLASALDGHDALREEKRNELDAEIRRVAATTAKGDAGAPGEPGKDADPTAIAAEVLSMIEVPEDGQPGKDANPEKIIATILQRIVEQKLLKPDHIAGLPQMLDDTRRRSEGVAMRGGGDTVVAGANITITKNAAGRKVITASSSAFTELTATGTLNGINAAFTFIQKPTYIISDGVQLKTTSKNGTVNWTWNAGTLTATMNAAPQEDIYGIA